MRRSAVILFFLLGVGIAALVFFGLRFSREASAPSSTAEEQSAFELTYLNAALGLTNSISRSCKSCHGPDDIYDAKIWRLFKEREALGRAEWVNRIALGARCGSCHAVPDPATLPGQSWDEVIGRMQEIMKVRGLADFSKEDWQDLRHFYFTHSREAQPVLPPDPAWDVKAKSPFVASVLGHAMAEREPPIIGHVQCLDLNRDGQLDVLVCDTGKGAVNWIHRAGSFWREESLAQLPFPTHATAFTNRDNGRLDLAVTCQTELRPGDERVGSIVLLINDGSMRFNPVTIIDQLPRVSHVEPIDLNRDGRIDFLYAAFGYITEGEVGWLEAKEGGYHRHSIVRRNGALRAVPVHLDEDGRMDFIALFAQEHEQISAFLNGGDGTFTEKVIFQASTPSFGLSGMEIVDLDGDGDPDILFTNGDNMDLRTVLPRPYHGVQWLENKGNLQFEWHEIRRFYGAYSARAGDLNGDGHLDIVVASMFNDWSDPNRASLIWLQNDGSQTFEAKRVATSPVHLITVSLGDLDGDGRLDIVAGAMNAFPPYPRGRVGRVTLWNNGLVQGKSLRPTLNKE